MSRKEVPRAGLIKAALAAEVTNAQVMRALRLGRRQVQRLKRRYQADGAQGLLHRLRGRPSPRRLPADVRQRVGELLQTTYTGFNDCHATEKLGEVEHLVVSRASVRRIRRALGLPAKHRRRPRQYHARRTPEAAMGALVQLDASPHAWLETRGPALALHGAIDDATGTVLALHFRPTEDLHGYGTLLHQLATAHGLPLALYGDRLTVFVRNDAHWSLEEQLQGQQHPTHFGQILRSLGIGFIPAGSPQAKGRIERLWLTLQDRLVSELRLRQIATPEAATAYLPAFLRDFNARFARPPADPHPVWRRPPRDLADLLSCGYSRLVARDNTVRLGPRLVQIPRGAHGRSYAGCRVDLRECLDGRLLVAYHGTRLAVQPTPGPAFILSPRRAPSGERRPRRSDAARPLAPPPHPPAPPAPPPRPRGGDLRPSAPGGRYGGSGRNPDSPRRRPPREPRPATPQRPAPTHPWRRAFSRRTPTLTRTRG